MNACNWENYYWKSLKLLPEENGIESLKVASSNRLWKLAREPNIGHLNFLR